jgi:phosphate transport system ATP-binding protein
MEAEDKIVMAGVSFFYGRQRVLDNLNETFKGHAITAITGPSGQGKSTLLSLFNGLWREIPGARCSGDIHIRLGAEWVSPLQADIPFPLLRRKVGMIFQEPNPLPMSIAKNMAFPLKMAGVSDKAIVGDKVARALKQAFLWDEVKDRLNSSALELSGGQKQRLCIARALVLEPEVLLCDEPTSSLDPKAAGIIEDLLLSLKVQCTILVVSHYMDQVRRIADRVLALEAGGLKQIYEDHL